MKRGFFLLVLGLLQLAGRSQGIISVSPDLELIKITENAYVHVSYADLPGYGRVSANGLIFLQEDQAILFDTPWNDSLTLILIEFMKDRMGFKITAFVPNHWHGDCMGGMGTIRSQKITSYANRLTIDIARQKGFPIPDHGFSDSLELKLGKESVHCYFLGAAHSKDNIVVWLPSEGILFPGCMCKSLDSRNLGNVKDGDISEYPVTIDKVIQKFGKARIVIPGHGAVGGPELLVHTKILASED
jgi:metallo-beta-lactamase class B